MFKSKAQQAWLEKNKPDVAKEFAGNTKPGAKLPEHIGDLKNAKVKQARTRNKSRL
jgi:hypothetical protein